MKSSIALKTLFCRGAFVLLALAPTCGVMGYVAATLCTPLALSPAAWSMILSEKTGLEIRIGKLERTLAGVYVVENLEIGDPESSEVWISAPRAEAEFDAKGVAISTKDAKLLASAAPRLADHLQHRILLGREEDFLRVSLVAADCKLRLSDEREPPLSMPRLELATLLNEDGPAFQVKAEIIEAGEPAQAVLKAFRLRRNGKPTTQCEWEIDGAMGLSARTLSEFSPAWLALGPGATFRGGLIDFGGPKPNYLLHGVRIADIDLAALGEAWGIKRLSGVATLDGNRKDDARPGAACEVREGKFSDIFGELQVTSGSVDGGFLSRLGPALGWKLELGKIPPSEVAFDELAVEAQLFGDKLRVRPLDETGGTVMERSGQRLAWQPQRGNHDARSVLSALFAEVESETLPLSQWIALLPEKRTGGSAATARGRKGELR